MKFLLGITMTVLIVMITVTGCMQSSAPKETTQPVQKKVFENKETILDAVNKLELESYNRNLTSADLQTLEAVLPLDDPAIKGFYDESIWMAEHNQGNHIGHGLSYIYSYVQTGIPLICVPHEIDHMDLYIEYNDSAMVERALSESKEGFDAWVVQSEQAKKLLPAYYKDFDTVKQEAQLALENVERKDYQGAMHHIAYVAAHQVC